MRKELLNIIIFRRRDYLLMLFFLMFSLGGEKLMSQSYVCEGKPISEVGYNDKLKKQLLNYEIYELNTSELKRYLEAQNGIISIELDLNKENQYALQLRENKIFQKGLVPKISAANGSHTGDLSSIKCYQGKLLNGNSEVALSVNDNFISGYIDTDKGKLYFEPLRYLVPGADRNYFIFYYAQDIIKTKAFNCLAFETDKQTSKLKEKAESLPFGCKEVEIAEASDRSMCEYYGDVLEVQDRITSIVNAVQANYNSSFNFNLTLIISDWFQVDCNGIDPWSSTTNAYDLLISFTSWAPSNLGPHDIGELFTTRDFDGAVIGFAWVAGACTSTRYNCIQDWSADLDLMRVTVAHELGHNFSCVHDFPGTGFIMTPSATNTNTWSPESIMAFNSFVPTRTCLAECSEGIPPIAQFTADKTTGCKPLTVNFTDLSSVTCYAWSWYFPGGTPSTSTVKNPVVNYTNAGNYTVTLIATNSSSSDTIIKPSFITVSEKPVASFTYNISIGSVQFSNTSTGADSIFWNFGDSTYSNEVNPVHLYPAPGNYTVSLKVFNECGSSILNQDLSIVFVPEANFKVDTTSGCEGLVFHFQDESLNNPDTWKWTFEGGIPQTYSDKNPEVLYVNNGTYNVMLEVSNAAGNDTIIINNLIVITGKPEADFSSNITDNMVSFKSEITGSFDSLFWDFGDGSISNETNPEHKYLLSGTYDVLLIAYNSCGNDTIIYKISIVGFAPKANFTFENNDLCAPVKVQYEDQSLNNPTSWLWSFEGGEPQTDTVKNPVIIYNESGNYSAVLIVSNAFGSDTLLLDSIILVKEPPFAKFNYTVLSDTVQFINKSSGATAYLWDFGDGEISNELNPTHHYKQSDTYTVTLTVTNECGSYSFTQLIDVIINNSVTNFVQGFSLYPNPNKGTFIIQSAGIKISDAFEIFDITGKYLFKPLKITGLSDTSFEIETGNLSKGIYLFIIKSGKIHLMKKFIVM